MEEKNDAKSCETCIWIRSGEVWYCMGHDEVKYCALDPERKFEYHIMECESVAGWLKKMVCDKYISQTNAINKIYS